MPSSPFSAAAAAGKKKQASKAKTGEVVAKCYSVLEVDPAPQAPGDHQGEEQEVLAYALDPNRGHSEASKPNTTETVWYLTSSSHHVTGNLELLTDLTPVSDRWVQSILGLGTPMQVLARGSVNSNGIILHDVWFVPDCKVNVVSTGQLALKWCMDSNECTFISRDDKTVVGKAYLGTDGLFEFDFFNLSSGAVWYFSSSVSQHMRGNLELLTDFNTIRPSHAVQTHTGEKLQVCGKGSVNTGQFSIPNISYVPGLSENVISISQLTDTGFTVEFGAD